MMDDKEIDVRAITRWLGVDGARAGLEACRPLTIELLRQIAERIGCTLASKSATRSQLIEELVRYANRRIEKPLSVLLAMKEEEIVDYLEKASPDREELLELLKEMKVAPSREGQKGLIRFAARELSETARFIAIASSGTQIVIDERREQRDALKNGSEK